MPRPLIALALLVVVTALLASSSPLAWAAAPVLYGVTGEGGMNPTTLYRIDHQNGNVSRVASLGNGGDGEEIAYNPQNGMLLHASGRFIGEDRILEWVHPTSGAVTPIKVSGDDCDEVTGLTYAGAGMFYAGSVDGCIYSITSEGVFKTLSLIKTEDVATGLAMLNGKLYATLYGGLGKLVTLNPTTGEITSQVPLQFEGDFRFTALAAHPCTGELYATMTVGPTEIRTPQPRSLVKLDPTNGKVTVVKNLGDTFAGLAFVGDDCTANSQSRAAAGAISSLQVIQAQSTQANLQRAAAPTAPPINPPTSAPGPSTTLTVRPPNTGDGGLLR